MKLLVVTDHTFHRTSEGVFDEFCFNRGFFDDYRAVFPEVLVAARMSHRTPSPAAQRSDGEGVRFVDLTDVHGARWAMAPLRLYCGNLTAAVKEVDAVCVRIPAIAAVFAARLARRGAKPVMFEQVGDPRLIGTFGWTGRLLGAYLAYFTRRIVRGAVVGSYVSQTHLQSSYPAGPRTIHEGISSIRLPDEEIRPARRFDRPPVPLRIILVASLQRYKDHRTLLRAVRVATRGGIEAVVDLVGDGPSRVELEHLADELDLARSVTFHGHVTGRARVNDLLDRADLFVMPSLGEGMPRAMIEAMSRGIATLGSRTAAMEELLPQEQTFPPGDHQDLAKKLIAAVRHPHLLNSWANHSECTAHRYAESVLSGRRRRLLTVLREAVERVPVHA